LATGYNKNVNMTVTSTLSFYTSIIDNEVRTDISSVSGDLSSMFPYFGSDYGESPRFLHTFSHQTNLTSLPDNLFSGYTNVGKYMFWATFYDCTNLTGYIPPTLFAGLIANGHPTGNDIWYGVFTNTQLVTECPSGTVEYTTGYKSTWDGKVSCTPTNTLSVTYSCGTGSGTAPASTTATYNASFTPAASTCTPPTGYHFTGWLVDGEWVEKPAGTAFTWQYVTGKTFTAQYAINTISLTFDNGSPMSCTFGGTFLPPTPAARPGWIFTGWKAVTCADKIKRQDTSTNGTAYAYQNDSTGAYGSSSENTSSYGITTDNTWAVEFDYGTVWGRANCNNTSGTPVIASVPTLASSGTNCWCQVTGFTVSGNSYTYGPQCTVLPVSSLWLFQGANGSTDTCANVCARSCAYIVQSVANLRGVKLNAVGQ